MIDRRRGRGMLRFVEDQGYDAITESAVSSCESHCCSTSWLAHRQETISADRAEEIASLVAGDGEEAIGVRVDAAAQDDFVSCCAIGI